MNVILNLQRLEEVPPFHPLMVFSCAKLHDSREQGKGKEHTETQHHHHPTSPPPPSRLPPRHASPRALPTAQHVNNRSNRPTHSPRPPHPRISSLPQPLLSPPNVPLCARRAHPKSWSYARPFALNTGLAAGLRLSWLLICFTGCCCGCPAAYGVCVCVCRYA